MAEWRLLDKGRIEAPDDRVTSLHRLDPCHRRYPHFYLCATPRHDPTSSLVFTPQPEGGFTVTSPVLPELVTEGDTLEQAFANVRDALAAVLELYAEEGRPLPAGVELPANGQVVWTDALVEVA